MNSTILSSVLVIYGSGISDTELLVMRVLVGVTNLAVIRDRSKILFYDEFDSYLYSFHIM